VKTEEEIGFLPPQSMEGLDLLDGGRGKKPPLELLKGALLY
jgi:hypothetical protein